MLPSPHWNYQETLASTWTQIKDSWDLNKMATFPHWQQEILASTWTRVKRDLWDINIMVASPHWMITKDTGFYGKWDKRWFMWFKQDSSISTLNDKTLASTWTHVKEDSCDLSKIVASPHWMITKDTGFYGKWDKRWFMWFKQDSSISTLNDKTLASTWTHVKEDSCDLSKMLPSPH